MEGINDLIFITAVDLFYISIPINDRKNFFFNLKITFNSAINVSRQENYCFKLSNKWVKAFKNEPSKICGRQPLKIL